MLDTCELPWHCHDMARHKKPEPILPPWYHTEQNPCVRSIIEDVYTAKRLAEEFGAGDVASCTQLIKAGEKSIKVLKNRRTSVEKRCAAGDRAARKFWEAKVCARQAK